MQKDAARGTCVLGLATFLFAVNGAGCRSDGADALPEGKEERAADAVVAVDAGKGSLVDAGVAAPPVPTSPPPMPMPTATAPDAGAPAPRPPAWPNGSKVPFYFHPKLENPLDPGAAFEAFRMLELTAAAAAWNGLLAPCAVTLAVRDPRIAPNPVATGYFASDWTGGVCIDGARQVWDASFFGGHGHHPNGVCTASFGHDPGVGADFDGAPGPGWTAVGAAPLASIDPIEVDVLGETLTQTIGMSITEADIVFHTHTLGAACPKIPWEWVNGAMFYDFKSVAMHELGHALGLNHVNPVPGQLENVMQPSIAKGQVFKIMPVDGAELRSVYPCAALPPAGGVN